MKVVGIDLGHCETAGAISKENQGRYEAEHINAQGHEQIIVTQIVLTDEQMRAIKGKTHPTKSDIDALGEIAIGNTLPNTVENGERFIYFKVPPRMFDKACANTEVGKECGITHGMVTACFANALIKSMFSHNPGSLSEGDIGDAELFIGCPATADWTAEDARKKYAELIKLATGVKSVEIIPESRAAMFSSVENSGREKGQRVSALNGALVFDFGSSTADCTYMLLGRKIVEFSWTLGASAIEREITASVLEELQSGTHFRADVDSIVRCENDIRKAKEAYYSGQYGAAGHDMVCVFKAKGQQNPVKRIVTIDDELMKYVVNERRIGIKCDSCVKKQGTWMRLCREFFIEAKEKLREIDAPIETIVLTGGASRMGFVKKLCCEVFAGVVSKENIICESNPSYTVANGLVWAATADRKVQACKAKAKAEITANASCRVDALKQSMRDGIYYWVSAAVKGDTNEWAAGMDKRRTIKELLEKLESRTQSHWFKERIDTEMRKSVAEWKKGLSQKLGEAINKQVKELYSNEIYKEFIVPHDVWTQLNGRSLERCCVNVSGPLNQAVLADEMTHVIRGVKHAIIWMIAVALAIPTAGLSLLAAAVVDLGTAEFLDNRIIKWQSEISRSYNQRQNLKRKINESMDSADTKAEMLKGIDAELDSSLKEFTESYDSMIDGVLTNAFEIVTLKRFDNAESGV